jgi:hypothetical protein
MCVGFLATNDEDLEGWMGLRGFMVGSAALAVALLTLAIVLLTHVRSSNDPEAPLNQPRPSQRRNRRSFIITYI